MTEGAPLNIHRDAQPSYIPGVNGGPYGGGTYTNQEIEPTLEAYENIFGPSARDIKQDLQRFKRHGRWHLPDILKGPNQYLTDRIDGLITDATNSPFTSRILPYKYITNVDGKIKWNVWSFDEGLASRVPYESAARTLTQSKRSYAGYTIRQGMAIVLEHNFMMTDAGRQNFRNQLQQLVGSIQLTNDLDVHMALVLAPSHEKHMREKYMVPEKSPAQICREFVDLFGFVQKNQNALDILIEEAKGTLRTWGSPMPDFMLCNSKLTFQLTMTPDATNYVTKGAEGVKRLRTGPDLPSYRGIGIVHTRAFSLETGQLPRDILRRRVRVAEYYRITPHRDNWRRLFQFYNEERDTWSTFTFVDLLKKSDTIGHDDDDSTARNRYPQSNADKIREALLLFGSAPAPPVGERRAGGGGGRLSNGYARGPGSLAHPLGARLIESGNAEQEEIVQIYKAMLKDRVATKYVQTYIPVGKDLIYAPGADPLILATKFYAVKTYRDKLPKCMKDALDWLANEKGHSDVLPDGSDLHEAIYKVTSICDYPRAFSDLKKDLNNDQIEGTNHENFKFPEKYVKIIYTQATPADREIANLAYNKAYQRNESVRGGNPRDVPAVDAWTKMDDIPAGDRQHVRAASGDFLLRRLQFRNYLRYGTCKELLKDPTKTEWMQALDMTKPREKMNFLDAKLRSIGGFYCPNWYKEAEGQRFTKWGDFIGYHAVVTSEMTEILCKRKAPPGIGASEFYAGTWLYEAIMTHNDAVIKQITDDLKTIAADILTDSNLNRSTISKKLTDLFRTAQGAGTFDCTQDDTEHTEMYWRWPSCETEDYDVFRTDARVPWVNEMYKYIPAFHETYDVTNSLLDQMNQAGMNISLGPLTQKLQPASLDPATITENDAICLLNMMAWRLWSDRTKSLNEVYPAADGIWPSFNNYVVMNTGYTGNLGTMLGIPGEVSAGGGIGGMGGMGAFGVNQEDRKKEEYTKDIELLIVRPNIEHYMLGIILGQGGESLGSTFWGQTELSCYDDSMHGIWGMSYKYNERAIVINERNLVRLWDIAYDGYVGGKDDTAVDWTSNDEDNPNSHLNLSSHTMDVTVPYRGPSMMVMSFDHGSAKRLFPEIYQKEYKANWPSPIVYYDRYPNEQQDSLAADFENIHVVPTKQFRVFDNNLYRSRYQQYFAKMPNFHDLHKIRKNAGQAAVENEVSSDALAFQGTMRVLNSDLGGVIQEIQGSGHHGPDFIGCASLRAGKGYKINSQPTIQRLV